MTAFTTTHAGTARPRCQGYNPELFFPLGEGEPGAIVGASALAQLERARAVCRACPLQRPCLEYALHAPEALGDELVGVWGATTSWERRALRAREAASPERSAVAAEAAVAPPPEETA